LILKPNMVLSGLTCPRQEAVDEVADATVRCLLRAVPAAVPGIAFLSGAHELVTGDDYPDFVVPLARAVVKGEVTRVLAICGSGVGACFAANKVPGVRAALITDSFSAHQG
jgi:hypothetical protein